MTKRARGAGRRPPQRRPSSRPEAARPAKSSDPRPVRATVPSQLDAAAEIADDVADGRRGEAADELRRVARSTPARARARTSSLLATKAATEYVYVAQDLRRILGVAVLLLGTMLLLWLLIVVLRVIPV